MLLEDIKKCLPKHIVVYLHEQKVRTLSAAAVMAGKYVLTHKATYSSPVSDKPHALQIAPGDSNKTPPPRKEERECFYCHVPSQLFSLVCYRLPHSQLVVAAVFSEE